MKNINFAKSYFITLYPLLRGERKRERETTLYHKTKQRISSLNLFLNKCLISGFWVTNHQHIVIPEYRRKKFKKYVQELF